MVAAHRRHRTLVEVGLHSRDVPKTLEDLGRCSAAALSWRDEDRHIIDIQGCPELGETSMETIQMVRICCHL